MTPEAFTALAAQGYNRIPVSTEVLADLETPVEEQNDETDMNGCL